MTATDRQSRDEARAAKLEELHNQLRDGVAALVKGDEWKRMLSTAAKFHTYSWRNVLLILAQKPDATQVAGYRRWQSLGRQVRKGEKGIGVLAPVIYKVQNEAGEEERRIRGWRIEYVFDVSQTEGDDLPDVAPTHLDGFTPEGLWDALAAQVQAAKFALSRGVPTIPHANGETDFLARSVVVGTHLGEAQAHKTLTHELAHVLLEHGSKTCRDPRSVQEVEAESVAFVVVTAVGMDASGYSFPYVAGWSRGDMDVIEKTTERVISTARKVLDALPEGIVATST